ncbi:MAG: hypothetical protein V1822_04020 [Candidatus Micrarchaeota archaeon]
MEICLKLTGDLEKLVSDYIKKGRATSKAEVVRIGLNKLFEENYDDISDDPELENYLKDVKSGKLKPKMSGPFKNTDELFKDLG